MDLGVKLNEKNETSLTQSINLIIFSYNFYH